MKVETKKTAAKTTVKIQERRLDTSVSSELKGEFLVLCKPPLKELVIDLSRVEFCDSSGLSALLIAERKMREAGGTVRLAGVNKKVLALIRISHLDRAFKISETNGKAAKK
jgi:anti-anti-sigma factor